MRWTYRIVPTSAGFAIYEVYSDESGQVVGLSGQPVHPTGETIAQLQEEVELLQRAAKLEPLSTRDLRSAGIDDDELVIREFLKRVRAGNSTHLRWDSEGTQFSVRDAHDTVEFESRLDPMLVLAMIAQELGKADKREVRSVSLGIAFTEK